MTTLPKNPWDQKRLEALVLDLTPLFKELIELDNVLQDLDYELFLCDQDSMPHAAELLRAKSIAKGAERGPALLRVTEFLAQLMVYGLEPLPNEPEQEQEQKQQESDDDYW